MMQWSLFSARLRCLAVIVAGIVCCDVAAAKEISCKKSGIAFDRAAYSAEYELFCKKETVEEDAFDKLRATKPKNWQQLIDFGQAFLPPHTVVDGTIMSSSKGHYGSVYMVTKQIYASHYMDGQVSLSVVMPDADDGGEGFYWLYFNRARIGLQHWIAGGHSGDLVWGILHLRKP